MWSVGNEPRSYRNASGHYFGKVANATRALDSTRCIGQLQGTFLVAKLMPVSQANHLGDECRLGPGLRQPALRHHSNQPLLRVVQRQWVGPTNKQTLLPLLPSRHTELIHRQMAAELRAWRAARGKPVMVTEYGADTVAGLHMLPGMVSLLIDALGSLVSWYLALWPMSPTKWLFVSFFLHHQYRYSPRSTRPSCCRKPSRLLMMFELRAGS